MTPAENKLEENKKEQGRARSIHLCKSAKGTSVCQHGRHHAGARTLEGARSASMARATARPDFCKLGNPRPRHRAVSAASMYLIVACWLHACCSDPDPAGHSGTTERLLARREQSRATPCLPMLGRSMRERGVQGHFPIRMPAHQFQ